MPRRKERGKRQEARGKKQEVIGNDALRFRAFVRHSLLIISPHWHNQSDKICEGISMT